MSDAGSGPAPEHGAQMHEHEARSEHVVDPSRDNGNAGAAQGQRPASRVQPGLAPPACVYFLRGKCRNGAACAFSHDQGATLTPCRFFTRGLECRYGDGCRYAHDPEARRQWEERPQPSGGRGGRGRGRGRGRGLADRSGPGARSSGRGAPSGADYVIRRVAGLDRGSGGDEYGSDGTYEDEMDERMDNMGFTRGELDDLLCQGVKPWDEDAWDVLAALRDDY